MGALMNLTNPKEKNAYGAVRELREEQFLTALVDFSKQVTQLEQRLSANSAIQKTLFQNSQEWRRLLSQKILPEFSEDSCLVVTLAGGTNTGKSTLFNLLSGGIKSMVRSTAAATSSPVLVTGTKRYEEGKTGNTLPGFEAHPLVSPEDPLRKDMPENTLWITSSEKIPEHMALLDTPDTDSIESENKSRAEQIRAAGDVVVAVLTPTKYRDVQTVNFFRQARESGRLIVPVMNKANPENNYKTARLQLSEFMEDIGLSDCRCFVVPLDYDVDSKSVREIRSVDSEGGLWDYLLALDVWQVKAQVYQDTLGYVYTEGKGFLSRIQSFYEQLKEISKYFHQLTGELSDGYKPVLVQKTGDYLYKELLAHRIPFMRGIRFGIARIGILVGRLLRYYLFPDEAIQVGKRQGDAAAAATISQNHSLRETARVLQNKMREFARHEGKLIGSLIDRELLKVDQSNSVDAIVNALSGRNQSYADIIRQGMDLLLRQWWIKHRWQRVYLRMFDLNLTLTIPLLFGCFTFLSWGFIPALILFVGAISVGDKLILRFCRRYADQWLDLFDDWKQGERERLSVCLFEKITNPVLKPVENLSQIFEADLLEQLKKDWNLCQSIFPKS